MNTSILTRSDSWADHAKRLKGAPPKTAVVTHVESIGPFGNSWLERLMHRILTQALDAIQKVVKVLGFMALIVVIFAPLGEVLFAAAGIALGCFIVWLCLENIDESDKPINLWPPDNSK